MKHGMKQIIKFTYLQKSDSRFVIAIHRYMYKFSNIITIFFLAIKVISQDG